LPEKVELKQTV